MADEYNRLAMYSMPVGDVVNHLAPQLPAGHPSNMLRALRDYIPQVQADDTSTMSGIYSRLGRTATALPRGALETMANWLEGTHNPNAVRIGEDTIAPLGLFGMGTGMANTMQRVARTPERIAERYRDAAARFPSERLGPYEIRRTAEGKGGGLKYEMFDGDRSMGHLLIDAPRHLQPAPMEAIFDHMAGASYKKIERKQPIAGTVTRIEVDDSLKGKGYGSKLLDVAEGDLKYAGAILHPGDTNMTDDFIRLYAKRDPEILRDAFRRMDISKYDDPSLVLDKALVYRQRRAEGGGEVLADNAKSSVPGTVVSAMGEAKAPRPEPGGLIPKAEAMGRSSVLAETNLNLLPNKWVGNHPYERADEVANALQQAFGRRFEVVKSGSAAGDSAYIRTPGGDIRISDHAANPKPGVAWSDSGNRADSMSPRAFVELVAGGMDDTVNKLLDGKPPNQYGSPRPNWMSADEWRAFYASKKRGGGEVLADNARSSVPGTVVNAMGEQPQTIRAYHGSPRARPDGRFDESKIGYGEPGFFFTDDPWLASRYVKGDIAPMQVVKDAFDESLALGHMAPSPSGGTRVVNRAEHDALLKRRQDEWHPEGANITPVDIDPSKLRTVDMSDYRWEQDYGRRLADQSREAKEAGFDGLRIRGMAEGNDPRAMSARERPDIFTIWGKGNVRSATTGDTLFSGSSSAPGLAANATQGDSDSGVTDILRRYGLLD